MEMFAFILTPWKHRIQPTDLSTSKQAADLLAQFLSKFSH